MLKEGDKVNLMHVIQGVFPNGKYKISNGNSHLLVDESDLVLSKPKQLSFLEKAALSALALSMLFNVSIVTLLILVLFV